MKYTIRSIVCEASCHSVTRSLGHSVTRSLGHLVTRSLGHSVTRSLGHSVTIPLAMRLVCLASIEMWSAVENLSLQGVGQNKILKSSPSLLHNIWIICFLFRWSQWWMLCGWTKQNFAIQSCSIWWKDDCWEMQGTVFPRQWLPVRRRAVR